MAKEKPVCFVIATPIHARCILLINAHCFPGMLKVDFLSGKVRQSVVLIIIVLFLHVLRQFSIKEFLEILCGNAVIFFKPLFKWFFTAEIWCLIPICKDGRIYIYIFFLVVPCWIKLLPRHLCIGFNIVIEISIRGQSNIFSVCQVFSIPEPWLHGKAVEIDVFFGVVICQLIVRFLIFPFGGLDLCGTIF